MNIDQIAEMAHEVNRLYCKMIGDDSQVEWSAAPQWQKESSYAGIWLIKHDPGRLPKESHNSWMAHKLREGWVYGSSKNEVTKRHPCLMSFEDLPKEQQVKDHLFNGVVKAMLVLT